MADIRDIISSNYLADGVQTDFYIAGMQNPDNAYNIVLLNNGIANISDYIIIDSGYVRFFVAPFRGTPVTIHAFKDASAHAGLSDLDNITSIYQVAYVSDGISSNFPITGPIITTPDHCIVTVNGFVLQYNTDYTISNNIVNINPRVAPARGVILTLTTFYTNTLTRGGVSPRDNVSLVTRVSKIADGKRDTYTITGTTNNKSVYCLVFLNNLKMEAGVDYILSHNRVKFNRILPYNTTIAIIAFGAPPVSTTPPAFTRVRYLDKNANLNERTLYRNYWREQISQYGMTVNYYVNLTNATNVDKIYGESPLAGYSEPEELNIAIKIDAENSIFTKFGLASDTDSTCIIHHDDFQEIFGPTSEPKAGDLIEFTEIGIDRLNYPSRGPRIMEIVDKNDEIPAEINNLAGHYVWHIKLKRFDYSHETSMLPELGTKDSTVSGETMPWTENPVDVLSKQIFDYSQHPCSNDKVYGDY